MRTSPIAFIAMLISHPANAIFVEGHALYEQCVADDFRQAACAGFIMGVVDMIDIEHAAGNPMSQVCIPDMATRGQIIDVVKQHMQENPKDRHLAAVVQVVVALRKAFPCTP